MARLMRILADLLEAYDLETVIEELNYLLEHGW
jgi:hypothetical protein